MPQSTDLSKLTVRVEPFPGVEPDGREGSPKYALGLSPRLRKMHTPGADPGLTVFTDRLRALYTAACIFKLSGVSSSLVLYRERPGDTARPWEVAAFLFPEVPALDPEGYRPPTLVAVGEL